MSDEKYKNIAIFLLLAVALLLWLAKKFKPVTLIAIGVIIGMAFLTPFLAMILSIPVFLVVYFDNQKYLWDAWDRLKSSTFGGGQN